MKKPKGILTNALLATSLATGIGACSNFENNLENRLMDEGFTKEQAEVGAAVALRRAFTEKTDKEDGTATYSLTLAGIKDEDILEVVDSVHDDLVDTLKFDGDIEWQKFKTITGMGEHLQKQEKVFKYHGDMLRKKVLHRKFEELVNPMQRGSGYYNPYSDYGSSYQQPQQGPKDPFGTKEEERYSIAAIFPMGQKEADFEAEYVKSARKRGELGEQKAIVEEIIQMYTFYEKVANPQYVIDKGEKKFIHRQRKAGLRITAYNLDNDKEKKPDYIEVFRMMADGKQESKPAVRIFKPDGRGMLEVVVADRDFENEAGYGVPDYVGRKFGVESARELMELPDLINFIFQKKIDEETMEGPKLTEMNKLYITKAGTLPMTPYEINQDGWEQYLPDYKKMPSGMPNSFNVHIMRDLKPEENDHTKQSEIKWIALQYESGGRVVEFYRPKDKFRGKKFRVSVEGNRISFTADDGKIESYDVKSAIEDKPYRIDFDRNPFKRWEIVDRDEDGKHFEAKRERAKTDDIIPKK